MEPDYTPRGQELVMFLHLKLRIPRMGSGPPAGVDRAPAAWQTRASGIHTAYTKSL